MIIIQTGMKQNEVIELLDGKTYEGVSFKFVEKKGISLNFDVTNGENDSTVKLVKSIIKSQEWGKILYFNVSYV